MRNFIPYFGGLLIILLLLGTALGREARPAYSHSNNLGGVLPAAQTASDYSLRFYGHGLNDIDRVKVSIDPAVPADVGAADFTLEWWMKANAAENNSGNCTTGNDNWITGNIIFDRDIWGNGDYGDFGVSLAGGRIAYGLNNGSLGAGICGTSNLADDQWHHVAVTRRRSDGLLSIFVDGQLEAQADGPDGDISYRDGRSTGFEDDPFLVIGAEKHDAGSSFPSYSGWVDEVRLSNILRYTGGFAPPNGPFTPDSNTVALYHFDEGVEGPCTGTVLDSSGAGGGPSHGTCIYGGAAPAGPVYTSDTPFSAPQNTPTATPTDTPVPTDTPTSPPVPTNTPTDTPAATAATTNTPTPTNTPIPPTNTPTNTSTASSTPTATATSTNTPVPTPNTNFALSFDGANDLVRTNSVPGTTILTIEAWVRPQTNNANGLLIVNADNNSGWSLELNNSQLTFWLATNQGWSFNRSTLALQAGQWYHVAATYGNGTAQVFVAGVGSTPTSVGTLSQGPTLNFGGLAGYPFFSGVLDEVRISNIIRYSSNFTPSTAPFASDVNTVGLWHFDENTGHISADSSTSANHATLGSTSNTDSADPTWATGYPFTTAAPPTNTPVPPTPTNTPLPATNTATNTPLPPTPTATPVSPTNTPTNTPLPPTPTATPVSPTNTPTPTPVANSNLALAFDGVDDIVGAGVIPGTGLLTIEGWVRPDSNNAEGVLIAQANDNSGWSLELNNGHLTLWLATDRGWRFRRYTPTRLQAGQWYHVAAAYNNGTAQVFVNGNGSGSSNLGTFTNGPSLNIGGLAGYAFFAGRLDEIRISNTVRYPANFTPPAAPFVPDSSTLGLWHFDAGTGQVALDASASGNHGILGNSSSIDNADPTWTQGFLGP